MTPEEIHNAYQDLTRAWEECAMVYPARSTERAIIDACIRQVRQVKVTVQAMDREMFLVTTFEKEE